VDEVLIAGEKLPGRTVSHQLRPIPDGDAADGGGRHAIEPVDAIGEPNPESGTGVGNDLAEPPHDGPLLRPDLGDAGEQVDGDREERHVAEALHGDGVWTPSLRSSTNSNRRPSEPRTERRRPRRSPPGPPERSKRHGD